MRLIEGKQYLVKVEKGSLFWEGTYILYFRKLLFSDEGLRIFNFSESLEEDSVFYNLFYPDDIFTIHEL